jgi:hypothetical protein
MKYIIALLLFFCLLFVNIPCMAGIYRYEDEGGVIHFTNCPRDPKFKLYIRESKEDVEEEERPRRELREAYLKARFP